MASYIQALEDPQTFGIGGEVIFGSSGESVDVICETSRRGTTELIELVEVGKSAW